MTTDEIDPRIKDIWPAPWQRSDWTGELVSVDGCDASDFTVDDVRRVVWFASTYEDESDWDVDTTGCVQLKDGRFVAWEANWGPTGNGFCCDAYGGTADITFAKTEEAVLAAMSDKARDLLARKS